LTKLIDQIKLTKLTTLKGQQQLKGGQW